MSKNHYTATVEVIEVSFTDKDHGHNQPKTSERSVQDVARLVLRADTLDGLRDKLASHVALIEN
jgi:hypothetical protein